MGDAGGSAFLEFDQVQKSYDQETLVVRGFDLSVAEGEFVMLLGPSGSGKSTVLMMLAGFEGLSSGDIRVRGRSIVRMPPYQRDIGIVFQNYALFPHMTVAESLAYLLGWWPGHTGQPAHERRNPLRARFVTRLYVGNFICYFLTHRTARRSSSRC